ncbi:MAG: methionine adenosyltransferase [Clostridiales bacterium]|nr:methionine adenosyltransferase [Clostridiales bacterium]
MKNIRLFTSESVTEGHPDKMCDQISDAILDELLKNDPHSRVACETAVSTGLVLVMGEISTNCYVDIPKIVRKTVIDIGYDRAKYGFDGNTCSVLTSINEQSADIALGVDDAIETRKGEEHDTGAGDQGMMFGYACKETDVLMPMPIYLAHKMAQRLSYVRKQGIVDYLRPDGKTQVTVRYEDDVPVAVDTVVVATQHHPEVSHEDIEKDIIEHVVKPCLPDSLDTSNIRYLINATGRFVIGGPMGDAGLTGRKIIVDTYGGYSRHGGGAFSGKDSTKVDRSAAYAARWVAKHIVAADLADKCEIEIAYAIGVAYSISIMVETFGTGKASEKEIEKIIEDIFDLRPSSIIKQLGLRSPIFKQTAAYGHFGREDLDLPWEQLSKLDEVKLAKKNLDK